jgi:hypothetical protein
VFDPLTFLLGLASGLVVGWFGHRLSIARSKAERRIEDETARIEHCAEIFAARVAYVVAWHRKDSKTRELKARREDLERRYPQEKPEVFLEGTLEWDQYKATEHEMVTDAREKPPTILWSDRIRRIDDAAVGVHRVLNDRRRTARS